MTLKTSLAAVVSLAALVAAGDAEGLLGTPLPPPAGDERQGDAGLDREAPLVVATGRGGRGEGERRRDRACRPPCAPGLECEDGACRPHRHHERRHDQQDRHEGHDAHGGRGADDPGHHHGGDDPGHHGPGHT